jgi:hypothetical protein
VSADQVGDVVAGELLPALAPAPIDPPALGDLPLPHYPPERHPLLVYLRRLQPSGRRSQHSALKKIARAITDGRLLPEDVTWHLLRYEHTSAIRDWLADDSLGHRQHLPGEPARRAQGVLAPGLDEH